MSIPDQIRVVCEAPHKQPPRARGGDSEVRRLKTTRVGVLAVVAGMIVASLSTPAFAGQGQPGPTPHQVGDPVTATNEVQSAIVVNGPASGGTFTLTVCPSGSGCTTTPTSILARHARDV